MYVCAKFSILHICYISSWSNYSYIHVHTYIHTYEIQLNYMKYCNNYYSAASARCVSHLLKKFTLKIPEEPKTNLYLIAMYMHTYIHTTYLHTYIHTYYVQTYTYLQTYENSKLDPK